MEIVWGAVIAFVLCAVALVLVFFVPPLAYVVGMCAIVAAVISLRE